MSRPAVFLDRDGVLNRPVLRDGKPHAPRTLEEFELLPGVEAAARRLKDEGFALVLVTNQPDVAKGTLTRETVAAMHDRLLARVPLDAIKVCWCIEGEACDCYKPKPGMLLEAAAELDLDLARSFMVGDRWRDVGAGRNAGCYTIFIDRGYAESLRGAPDAVCADLGEAAEVIVARSRGGPAISAQKGCAGMNAGDLTIKLFADGADLDGMKAMYANPVIKGFTTNPTLMRKAGIADYKAFALEVLRAIPDRPVSFEVFADDLEAMETQAREIATWGANVNVKIPVTNTKGVFCGPVIRRLSAAGIPVNVTAVFTLDQVIAIADCLAPQTPAIVSVFAGRIADTGRDPVPHMKECRRLLSGRPRAELLWASPREVLNIVHAQEAGCHIITATNDLLAKLASFGKDLGTFSLETVQMFHRDAAAAGYTIAAPAAKRAAAS